MESPSPKTYCAPRRTLPLIMVVGLAMATLNSMRITLIAAHSKPEERGVASAIVGPYGGASQLVVPAAYGLIASATGLQMTFVVAGALPLLFAAAIPVLFKRAFATGPGEGLVIQDTVR